MIDIKTRIIGTALICLSLMPIFSLSACVSVSSSSSSITPTLTPTTTPALTPSTVTARTYALPGDQVFPEGIAYDPTSNSFFVGSTSDGTIFRGNLSSGAVTVFSAGGLDGRTSAIGMKVDSIKRWLWVAGGATGNIFVYNVDTGSLIRKYDTYPIEQVGQVFLNDIAIAPNGDAYITDSRRPVLFKVGGTGAQPDQLESWVDFTGTAVQFVTDTTALNGIVITQDGKYILVVHSTAQKLFRIAVDTKAITEVNLGGTPQGGDGMVLESRMLYVLTRTQDSDMIVRIQMSPDFSSGTIQGNFRDASFAFPTTIAKVGNRMLVVNSQFNKRGAGLQPSLPFTVSDIPIPPEEISNSTPPTSQGVVEATAMITEIAGSNISFSTPTRPFVLKFDDSTVVIKFNGSIGTIQDLRPGMNVRVYYDPATNITSRIEIK